MEKPLEVAQPSTWGGWGLRESPGQGEWRAQNGHPPAPATCMGGRLHKGAVVPVSASVSREGSSNPCPPTLALKLVNSVPPRVSLALLELPLPLEPRASRFVSKCVCGWASQEDHPCLPQPSISLGCNPHWFSQPEVMGTLLPVTGALAWGA